jgi:hypothetical protein
MDHSCKDVKEAPDTTSGGWNPTVGTADVRVTRLGPDFFLANGKTITPRNEREPSGSACLGVYSLRREGAGKDVCTNSNPDHSGTNL